MILLKKKIGVDFQCVSFCCTGKQISYTYTYIPSFLGSFLTTDCYRVLSRVLCYTVGSSTQYSIMTYMRKESKKIKWKEGIYVYI